MLAAASEARADVAPPDICMSVGQPCNNAETSSGSAMGAGTCQMSKCSHTAPPVGDAGAMTVMTDCMRCLPGSTAGDAGTGGTTDAGSSGSGSSSKSGCSVGPRAADTDAALFFGLGAVLFACSARSRSRRSARCE
jgi:hypothetical protein